MEKRSLLISFSGIDGSGKSTLVGGLGRYLREQGIETRTVWGAYELYLLRPVLHFLRKMLLKRKQKGGGAGDYGRYQDSLEKIGRISPLFKIYRAFILCEYLLEILVKVRLPLLRGRNIIADRYVFDTATNLAANYGFTHEAHRRLIDALLKVCPKPDLAFYVDVPEEVAVRRKKDIPSILYVQKRRKYYRDIAARYGMILLDGSTDPDALQEQMTGFLGPLLAGVAKGGSRLQAT